MIPENSDWRLVTGEMRATSGQRPVKSNSKRSSLPVSRVTPSFVKTRPEEGGVTLRMRSGQEVAPTKLRATLEGEAQGELDEARGARCREDFAEGAAGANGLHVSDRRIGEVGVIPQVKEISGEAQIHAFGDGESLQ